MKRLFVLALLTLCLSALHAQAIDATVCDILKDPAAFNGKIVRVKGTVAASFDRFAIEGIDCGKHVNGIWLSYPEGTKAKAGPVAIVELQAAKNFAGTIDTADRVPVTLEKSKDFKQFDSLLSAQFKESSMCLGCSKNKVNATLVGRLDGVSRAVVHRDGSGKIVDWSGFGNANAYSARLVLQSVSDVSQLEIDYSKAASATKSDSFDPSVGGDPVAKAHAGAKAFGPGNSAGDEIERAANAFGKPGDKNGVNVSFGSANEASARSAMKSDDDSPDGVIYNCTFTGDRLKGDAMARAIVHNGMLIAQLRNPLPGTEHDGLFELEYRAWATTSFSAVASGQKTLTIYGGYLLWNADWPPADRTQFLDQALKAALTNEGLTME